MGKGEGSGGVNTSDERASATTSFGGTSSLKKAGKSGGGKSVTINTAVKYGGYGIGVHTPDEFKVSELYNRYRSKHTHTLSHTLSHNHGRPELRSMARYSSVRRPRNRDSTHAHTHT